jgi:hypothetical protein
MRELFPETPYFRDVNGDFQLKRLSAYLGTEETSKQVIALDGSFQGSNLQKFVSKANLQPNFKAQPHSDNVE